MPRTRLKKGFLGSELFYYCDICNKEFKEKIGGGILGDIAKGIAAEIAGDITGWQARRAVYNYWSTRAT